MALKRLYFLEKYKQKEQVGSYQDYRVEEIEVDSIPNFTLGYFGNEKRDKAWLKENDLDKNKEPDSITELNSTTEK